KAIQWQPCSFVHSTRRTRKDWSFPDFFYPRLRGRRDRFAYFLPDPPHISSSANGCTGPAGFGFGWDLRMASARYTSPFVVILMFDADPSTTYTGCPAASTSWASSVISLPALARLA